ncbi:MAG TPA: arginase family protein, partial [Solirubrobacteraceae bacterium]
GGQVEDALGRGAFPILTAGDCSICTTTLPAVVRHRPDAHVLWLDAHGDFNSPDTTSSGFLGGMCLAAACGVWDPGLGVTPSVDPARVVMCGVRALEDGEGRLVDEHGVEVVKPGDLAERLAGLPVYVHLDLDVLDPSVFPAQFPEEGGLSDGGLRTLLGELADGAEILGIEITAFEAPDDDTSTAGLAELVVSIVEPLIARSAPE